MKTIVRFTVFLLILLVCITSCGKKENKKETENDSSEMSVTDESLDINDTTTSSVNKDADNFEETTVIQVGDGQLNIGISIDNQDEFVNGDETTGNATSSDSNTVTDKKPVVPNVPAETSSAVQPNRELKWEEFYALSSADKDRYLDSFASNEEFYNWMIKAQSDFKVEHPDIEIGPDGSIDLSKLG